MGDWWYVRFRYHSKFIFHLKKEIPGGPDHSTARRLWNNNLKAWLVHDDWTRHLFFLLHKFFKDIVMTRRAGQSHRVQPPMSFSEHERALAEANPDPIELDLFGGERAIDANGEPGEEDPKAIPKDVKDKITFV
ncbi:MAG: hypothetical protein AMS21_01105 [Gemmatimonas sp. SG8_38_2]|nr:MAG: hypothetical protein AMS21_01105 [Gemmatimonas sp. SG8_38_2]